MRTDKNITDNTDTDWARMSADMARGSAREQLVEAHKVLEQTTRTMAFRIMDFDKAATNAEASRRIGWAIHALNQIQSMIRMDLLADAMVELTDNPTVND